MLNLNEEDDDPSQLAKEPLPIWKILIFDPPARDIISTVLKVNDLRENGITVHM